MKYVIFINFLAMNKWLNLNKKGHDADDNATKSPKAELSIGKQASNVQKEYDESFLQFGLLFKNCNGNQKPLCVICNELKYETIKIEKTS